MSVPETLVAPLIRLDGLFKSYRLPTGDSFDAVHDVSLLVRRGDAFGIVGQSGAGKSTLLRLVNLLERPDRGRVEVEGRELTALGKRELRLARQSIGMIFQQFNLLQNATVFDNVAFPLRLHGSRSRAEIAARVAECLAIVGLNDKRDSYPAQLSGGQKQRVAIARALAPNPSVLLCDEPTSALDADTTRQVLRTLADINTRLGVTIVIVTHELEVVRFLCRQVAVVERGAVAEQFALAERGVRRRTSLGRALQRLVDHPPEVDDADAAATEEPEPVHA
ncbi:ABC transporter ATP-binding protein [Rubrivivax gelatinosus]|uniref:methionine ABC transporter ATP-binding protein n=1 Tax=Rubrivivax gelatinosus TaxID=28068 RepID=UPI001903014A|nr:ATP-binding cassette domain-containing protein [Rubrivivax gelatinosus]MBK1613563.1 ABC transporter ATP-binding protein [Rubrivivax gelatinosus]